MNDRMVTHEDNKEEKEISSEFRILRSFDPKLLHKKIENAEDFLNLDEGALSLAEDEVNFFYPPLFFSRKDRIFFQNKYWRGHIPQIGRRPNETRFMKSKNKIVTGLRGMEGLIFDDSEVFRGINSINTPKDPRPFRKSDTGIMIEISALSEIPYLQGKYIVGYNGVCHNYYHSIIECMIPMLMMANIVPEAKILFPRSLENCPDVRHAELLAGTVNFDKVVYYDEFIQVEEVFWIHCDDVSQIPPSQYIEFRNRTLSNMGIGTAKLENDKTVEEDYAFDYDGSTNQSSDLNIYVKRRGTRGIFNSEEVESLLFLYNFKTVFLEDMNYKNQISLFYHAKNVIAPHGAGLTNLIFSNSGTNVIEIAPNTEFRPFFWMISEKMRLNYTVLACATDINDFNGRLIVDVGKLEDVITALARYD